MGCILSCKKAPPVEKTETYDHPIPPRPPSDQSYPWFVKYRGCELDYYSISEDHYNTRIFEDIDDQYLLTTNHRGWLFLQQEEEEEDRSEDSDFGDEFDISTSGSCFCLWNINSSEKIRIPDLAVDTPYSRFNCCLLSSSPKEVEPNNCWVFLFNDTEIFFCKVGDGATLSRHVVFGDDENNWMYGAVMLEDKKVYVLCNNDVVISVTPTYNHAKDDWELALTTYRADRVELPPDISHFGNHIIQDKEDLILVRTLYFSGKEVYDILVYKFDFSKVSWELLENIGETTMFLSSNSTGVACNISDADEKRGVRRNCIYFMLPNPEDEGLYTLDVEDRVISRSLELPKDEDGCSFKFRWILF